MSLETDRQFWIVASKFPTNKEPVYPGHAGALCFDEQAKGKVLEYGCGGGADSMSLARRGADVTFVDIVPGNVEITKKRMREAGFEYDCAELKRSEHLPFDDEFFDSVNTVGVLHHIEEPLPVIKEFKRVLKPGGRVYAMLYTELLHKKCSERIAGLKQAHGWSEGIAFSHCTDGGGYARSYTVEEGRLLFESAGFTPIEERTYNEGNFRVFISQKE